MKGLKRVLYVLISFLLLISFFGCSEDEITKNVSTNKGWQIVGDSGISYDGIDSVTVAFINGNTPVVASRYGNLPSNAVITTWNGSSWTTFSNEAITSYAGGAFDIDSMGNYYVAQRDEAHSGNATVSKWDGSSWTVLGSPGLASGTFDGGSLKIGSDDLPIIAYRDADISFKATARKWDGTSWNLVGSQGFSTADLNYLSMVLDLSDNPIVAYNYNDPGFNLSVQQWNGSNWVYLGGDGFASSARYPTIIMGSDGNPVVAYMNEATSELTIVHWDGNTWEEMGSSPGTTEHPVSMALDSNGNLHVAFSDKNNDGKLTVMSWSGTSWSVVGVSGFTTELATSISLAFDNADIPYVGFADLTQSNYLTVMKYDELTAPSTPDAAQITADDTQLVLTWDTVTGADSYEVWYSSANDSSGATQVGGIVSATNYTITSLVNGTTYYVWLKAVNTAGTSDFGSVASAIPEVPVIYSSNVYNGSGSTGGTVPIDSGSYTNGQEVTVLGNSGNLVKTENGLSFSFICWTNSSGVTYTNNATFTMGSASVTLYAKWSALRETGPAGGLVFYDKGSYSDGWRYLEIAPQSTEVSGKEWGSEDTWIGGTSTNIGSGQTNTTIIVNWLDNNTDDGNGDVTHKTERAAYICDTLVEGGESDWFLPSLLEMRKAYINLHTGTDENSIVYAPVGNFTGATYWTSSEDQMDRAHMLGFDDGEDHNYGKNNLAIVRAVRGF